MLMRTVFIAKEDHERFFAMLERSRECLTEADTHLRALEFDMAQWFTPTAANFFSRVSRPVILAAMAEAKGIPAKRSWEKLKKAELAALAERELAGTRWLPQPLRA